MRSSSSDNARVMVSFPARRPPGVALRAGGVLTGVLPPFFAVPSSSSSVRSRARLTAGVGGAAGAPLSASFSFRRRAASCSARRRVSSSAALRASSSVLRLSAASRSRRMRSSSTARRAESSSARLRASSSKYFASVRARRRASFSSSVSSRKTTPPRLAAARRASSRRSAVGCKASSAATCLPGLSGSTTPLPGATRARFFSTTTALLRPWLKLWRTVEVSVRFSDSVLPPRARAPLSSVSLIRSFHQPFHNSKTGKRASARLPRLTVRKTFPDPRPERPKPAKPRRFEDQPLRNPPWIERCMYHILPPQSQAQFGIGERPDNKGNMAPCPRSGLEFAPPFGSGFRRFHDENRRVCAAQSLVEGIEAQNQFAGPPSKTQMGQNALDQPGFGAFGKAVIGGSRRFGRPGEKALGHSLRNDGAICADPYSASRKLGFHIGNHLTIGRQRKTQ